MEQTTLSSKSSLTPTLIFQENLEEEKITEQSLDAKVEVKLKAKQISSISK